MRLMSTGEPGLVRTRWTAGDDLVVDLGARDVERARPEGGAGAGALAGRVLEGQVVAEGEPELEHPEQEHHEHRDRHGELDEALAPAMLAAPAAIEEAAHRTGSMRMAFDSMRVYVVLPSPMNEPSGVNGV